MSYQASNPFVIDVGDDPGLSLEVLVKKASDHADSYSQDNANHRDYISMDEEGLSELPSPSLILMGTPDNHKIEGKQGGCMYLFRYGSKWANDSSAANAETRRKNKKRAAKRKVRNDAAKESERTVRQKTAMSSAIHIPLSLSDVGVSKDMLTVSPVPKISYPKTLEEVKADNYRIVEWDGK